MNPKQTQRMQQIMEAMDAGVVKTEELTQIVEMLLSVIKSLKDNLDKTTLENKLELSSKIDNISYELNNKEISIQRLVNEKQQISSKEIRKTIDGIILEINRVESLIPNNINIDSIEQNLSDKISRVKEEISNIIEGDLPKLGKPIRDALELLQGDERLDISAIKGLDKNDARLTDSIINRAIGIVDQRTSFLINKVSNLQTQVNNISTTTVVGGSGYQAPLTGVVDGSNKTFTWATAPNALAVDNGRVIRATSSDETVNWTGTTTTVLTIAPKFDIFAVA